MTITITSFDKDQYKNCNRVKFDNSLDTESIINILKEIIEFELEEYKEQEFSDKFIDLKGLSTESLLIIYKFLLLEDNIINSSIILNIGLLVNGYNTLDDKMFESDNVWVSDMEQLLDIKLDLSNEIVELQTEISKWFLSCLKSMHKVEYTYLDNIVDLPLTIKKIFAISSFLSLSSLFSKSKSINTGELPLVVNANFVINDLIESSNISSKLLMSLIK